MSLVTKMTTLVKLLEWTVVIFFPSVAVHGICNAILVWSFTAKLASVKIVGNVYFLQGNMLGTLCELWV